MSKKTIIDWQRDSLLVAVASAHGNAVAIEQLSEQPIGHTAEGGDELLPLNGDAAQGLVRAIDELGLRKSEVSVILSRDLVEVRTISVPRIDADELPDVIRFQAQRQLANMGDSWTLDYVLLPDSPGQEMLTALVGAISPATLQIIEAACEGASLTLAHVFLRPIEIARFVVASGKLPAREPSLVICISEQHADLLILDQGQIVQVRSTKLPLEAAPLQATLSGELRRSLMAAAVQLGSRPIKHAVLIASPTAAESTSELLATLLECQIALIDPANLLSEDIPQRRQLGDQFAQRLVAIAGGVGSAAVAAEARVDFKSPKKRPPPQNRMRTYVLAASAVVLLALGGLTWWLGVQRELDDQLARFQSEKESRKEALAKAQDRVTQVQEIDRFLQSSPNWLDELTYLATNMPPAEKVLMGEPAFTVLADGNGRISMPVAVDSSSTIGTFESSLRDDQHIVAGKNSTQLDTAPGERYKWRVDESIMVRDRGWNLIPQLDTSRSAGQTPAAPSPPKPASEAQPPEAQTAVVQPPADEPPAAVERPPAPALDSPPAAAATSPEPTPAPQTNN